MASSTSHTPNTVTVFTTRHVFGSSTETKTSHSSSSVYTRFDGSVEVKVTVVLYITEVFPDNCTRYLTGRTIEYPNPDISGRGVTIAFLASAYLVLATILAAYWLGALPDGLVREVDHRLLFARRKRLGKAWTAFFEEVVLVFSDQQLITGLAILVAGYVQLLGANLGAYHWNSVIYLAWLSSTVHLMSLSVLRTRLRRSLVLRTIRLGVMLLLLVLLLVALIPTTKDSWAAIGSYTSTLDPGVPARCLFGDALASAPLEQEIMDRDSWISYLSLLGGFAWKATQLFDRPHSWLRHWGRARVECFLERRARAVTRRRQSRTRRAKFAFIAIIYVVFVASMEFLESFFFTVYVLGLALAWGSYKLLIFREFEVGPDVKAAEGELGFGQILPLLLLVQPAFTAVDIYLQQKTSPSLIPLATMTPTRTPTRTPSPINPSSLSPGSLQDIFSSDLRLLSATEKAERRVQDPVLDLLYESRIFRVYLVYTLAFFIMVFFFTFSVPFARSLIVIPFIYYFLFFQPIVYSSLFFPWSKRLR